MYNAIPTYYYGYQFLSKNEARTAVLLEGIGADWRYEEEGYRFEDGTQYLPDYTILNFICPERDIVEPSIFYLESKGIIDFSKDSEVFRNSKKKILKLYESNELVMVVSDVLYDGKSIIGSFEMCEKSAENYKWKINNFEWKPYTLYQKGKDPFTGLLFATKNGCIRLVGRESHIDMNDIDFDKTENAYCLAKRIRFTDNSNYKIENTKKEIDAAYAMTVDNNGFARLQDIAEYLNLSPKFIRAQLAKFKNEYGINNGMVYKLQKE